MTSEIASSETTSEEAAEPSSNVAEETVLAVRERKCTTIRNGAVLMYTITEYDQNDNVLLERTYRNDELKSEKCYEYDPEGRVLVYISLQAVDQGMDGYRCTYQYEVSENTLIVKIYQKSLHIDSQGNETYAVTDLGTFIGSENHVLSPEGNLLKKQEYDEEGILKKETIYDSEGNPVSSVNMVNQNGETYYKIEEEYNRDGLTVSSITTVRLYDNLDRLLTDITEVSYQYEMDDHGNAISCYGHSHHYIIEQPSINNEEDFLQFEHQYTYDDEGRIVKDINYTLLPSLGPIESTVLYEYYSIP